MGNHALVVELRKAVHSVGHFRTESVLALWEAVRKIAVVGVNVEMLDVAHESDTHI